MNAANAAAPTATAHIRLNNAVHSGTATGVVNRDVAELAEGVMPGTVPEPTRRHVPARSGRETRRRRLSCLRIGLPTGSASLVAARRTQGFDGGSIRRHAQRPRLPGARSPRCALRAQGRNLGRRSLGSLAVPASRRSAASTATNPPGDAFIATESCRLTSPAPPPTLLANRYGSEGGALQAGDHQGTTRHSRTASRSVRPHDCCHGTPSALICVDSNRHVLGVKGSWAQIRRPDAAQRHDPRS